MPNIKSAMKRVRSDAKKAEKNKSALTELKTLATRLLLLQNEPEKAKEFSVKVISKFDRAVSRGIIPQGRADRKKSRIAQFLAKLEETSDSAKKSAKKS